MSGAFGWQRNNDPGDAPAANPGYFNQPSRAVPDVVVTHVNPPAAAKPSVARPAPVVRPSIHSVAVKLPVPNGQGAQKTTGEIVIVVALDVTPSMSERPVEIFKRLSHFHNSACDYFGTDNIDVLFIAHGDARTDRNAIQIGRVARGHELEPILASFDRTCGGGGQGSESHEIIATYLTQQLDTSSARQVYTFFVTDEAACDQIDPRLVERELGIRRNDLPIDTKQVFDALRLRSNVYTILFPTDSYSETRGKGFRASWEHLVGRENVLALDDERRTVDVMLGVFAKTTGQIDRFSKDLVAWQGNSVFAQQNVKTVMGSIALVGANAPQLPSRAITHRGTKSLLLPSGTPPTRTKK